MKKQKLGDQIATWILRIMVGIFALVVTVVLMIVAVSEGHWELLALTIFFALFFLNDAFLGNVKDSSSESKEKDGV